VFNTKKIDERSGMVVAYDGLWILRIARNSPMNKSVAEVGVRYYLYFDGNFVKSGRARDTDHAVKIATNITKTARDLYMLRSGDSFTRSNRAL
jgi:hypothetical protein